MAAVDGALRELQQQRDGLKQQLGALEKAIAPTDAAEAIMTSIKGADPFNKPEENEWVAGSPGPKPDCTCVIL